MRFMKQRRCGSRGCIYYIYHYALFMNCVRTWVGQDLDVIFFSWDLGGISVGSQ